ncbi:hypothetical protein N9N67_09495 [Bacteriovoracaceae bacterium]|nr:hypothetical protein [Bacteriovoracaceae bacterium]
MKYHPYQAKLFWLLIFFSLTFSTFAQSQKLFSYRNCSLLPITDSVGGALGNKVYESVETYLKRSGWCSYKSHSALLNVFARYRQNLRNHLLDSKVMKLVAEKLGTGTNIRIHLWQEPKGVNVSVEVIGSDGEEIVFSERSFVAEDSPPMLFETIKNWLEVYEASIPYDGLVIGVVGEQVTFDIRRGKKINIGQGFQIKKLIQKRKHPLLKKVVAIETKPIAKGKVFNVDHNQSLGQIKLYQDEVAVRVGDFVTLEKFVPNNVFDDRGRKSLTNTFGKLGVASLTLDIDSVTANIKKGTKRTIGGNIFGASAKGELWVTRNYFVLGEFSRRTGNLSKSKGDVEADPASSVNTNFKVSGGYKYLPLGFFYGPQIDLYAGYGINNISLEESSEDGFSDLSFSGFLFGFGGNVPILPQFRAFGRVEIIPFPTVEEEAGIYSNSAGNASSMLIEFGVNFWFNQSLILVGGFEMSSNLAKYSERVTEFNYKENVIKLGVAFNF